MSTGSTGIMPWQENIFQTIIAFSKRITQPSVEVEPRQRRRIRLLAAFLLLMTVNTLVGSIVIKGTGGNAWLVMMSSSATFLGSYFISRSRYYRMGLVLALVLPAVPPVSISILKPPEISLMAELMWLSLPLLISGLMLTVRQTIILSSSYIALIIVLVLIGNLGVNTMGPLMAFLMIVTFIVIAIAVVRRTDESEIKKYLTERIQAEKSLRDSEEKFSKVFRLSPQEICITRVSDGKTVEINESFTRFSGYTREDVLGETSTGLDIWTKPGDRQKMLKILKENGRVHNEEFEFRIKSGEIRTQLFSAESINFNGEECLIAIMTDITERKQMERFLRESEEKFSKAFNSGPQMIIITRARDNVTMDVNDSFIKATGFTREEAIGRTAEELGVWVAPEDNERLVRMLTAKGYVHNEEFGYHNPSGETSTHLIHIEPINIGGEDCWISMLLDISERKRMETALRESEEKFSKAFHASPEIIAITTVKEGKYVDVNDSYTLHSGYSRDELVGHNTTSLHIWANKEDRAKMTRMLREKGNIRNAEFDFRMKSGEIRTWLFSMETITIGGEPCHIGVSIDITERKRMEQALRDSEDKFSKAFHAIPESISISTLKDGIFLDVNESFLARNGYTREEVIGHNAKELILLVGSDGRDRMQQLMQENGRFKNEEFELEVKTGETHTLLMSADTISLHGEPCLLIVGSDITERKRMEQALRDSEEKFSKAFSASPNAICILATEQDQFIEINESFCRFTGYSVADAIGRNSSELNLWIYPAEFDHMTKNLQEKGSIYNQEYHSRTKSGEIRVGLFSANVINIGGRSCVILVITDITEQKQAEDKLKHALADLEQSSAQLSATNKELESFSYSVSHDLRSPLRSIDGFSQALLEDYNTKLDETGRDYLNRLRGASQKMGELIDGLLKLSRLTRNEMHPEEVDLSALAKEISTRLQETHLGSHADFIIDNGLSANGDPQLIRVLLENLLGNAWKFTRKTPHARIEFGSTTNGNERTFFIKDNGAGFDMAYKDKLFGAFQRLHDSADFPGTGIGLATVQRIINRHRGSIRAEGRVGKGATFYFTLS